MTDIDYTVAGTAATVTPTLYYGPSQTTAVPYWTTWIPTIAESAAVLATLTDADKEALRTMIREEIAVLKEDIAREVVKEITKQTRLGAGAR